MSKVDKEDQQDNGVDEAAEDAATNHAQTMKKHMEVFNQKSKQVDNHPAMGGSSY